MGEEATEYRLKELEKSAEKNRIYSERTNREYQ